ncbi:MAG TPA: FadR/GntR family transcriptional regulator [Pseudonocardia sp.]|jgi:DNA-binding FadR family transcriptional regulator|nr:FadR/GntR family transcriptional regulator [Pseudonocardia sp.]
MMSSTADRAARTAGATRHRLSEDVAEAIKDGLIADGLRAGDRLPTEPELARLYDVSRTVVREAGRILVERGLVDIRPGRGMVVAEFDGTSLSRQYRLLLELKQGSFRQLMEMRLALEVDMTEHAAARHTPADDRRIEAALTAFTEAGADQVAALEADLEFHAAVAAAAHNPFFGHAVNPINDYLRHTYRASLGYLAAREHTRAEHTAIAEAIFAGDREAARRAARRHLERILDAADELAPEPPAPESPAPVTPDPIPEEQR